jgi:hypothetical protein
MSKATSKLALTRWSFRLRNPYTHSLVNHSKDEPANVARAKDSIRCTVAHHLLRLLKYVARRAATLDSCATRLVG